MKIEPPPAHALRSGPWRAGLSAGCSPVPGFTVIELIVTVAILGIVLAIAIPSLQRYAVNGNLRTAARDFMGTFSLYKESSMAENRNYTITLNQGSNQYRVQAAAAAPLPAVDVTRTPADHKATMQSITGGGTVITFSPRGTLTIPPSGLVLRNSRGSIADINWNVAGRISVQFTMQ